MKKAIIIKKIKNCSECPHFYGYAGSECLPGGKYLNSIGNGERGSYPCRCKKQFRKTICDIQFNDSNERNKAEQETLKIISKIPKWCPLENYYSKKPLTKKVDK